MRAARAAVAIAGIVLTATSLGACGGKDDKAASSSPATNRATATRTSTSSRTAPSSAAATTHPSATSTLSGTTTCAGKQTSATIGGAHKCIEAGQMCSHQHAGDYTQYGFTCEDKNGKYVLRKS